MLNKNTNMPAASKREKIIYWIKRLGVWGFLFFLIKGLLWLVLAYWLVK